MKRSGFVLLFIFIALGLAPSASAQTGPAPTCQLTADSGVVLKGGTVNLSWRSQNAVGGTITSIGSVGPSGTQGVIPTRTTEYVGLFTGAGGTARCSATIIVTLPTGGTVAPEEQGITPPPEAGQREQGQGGPFPQSPSAGSGQQTSLPGGEGLVPCAGLNCQMCHLAQLVQNIVQFVVFVSIPLMAILIAWAGAIYFTSGVVDKKAKAKSILQAGLLGFLIAITAWMVVNTILYVLLDQGQYPNGSWFNIQCVADSARPRQNKIETLVQSVLGGLKIESVSSLPTLSSGDGGFLATLSCPAGSTYRIDAQGSGCYSEEGTFTQPTYNVPSLNQSFVSGTQQYATELSSICMQLNFSDCATAQAVMAVESSGRAGVISSAGCVGLMQVCPGTARTLDPTLAGLSNAEITQRLMDPNYNMTLGVQYLSQLENQFGSGANMIAAYNGGPKANSASVTCPGQTYWQCAANSGYAETRNYVPKVLAAKNLLR